MSDHVNGNQGWAPRIFGRVRDTVSPPNLTEIQTKSYSEFLQAEAVPSKRKSKGLETVIKEVFPITSYDKKLVLEYLGYELGRPRYSPLECRQLRLTYGYPLKLRLRLNRPSGAVEETVYLGELPIMLGGGEFIVNGAERLIVTQLHRSPGVEFQEALNPAGQHLHSCRIIPERGSWIEFSVTKKHALHVKIDQSGKFPATMFLRAMSERLSTDADFIRHFYPTEKISLSSRNAADQLKGKPVVGDLVHPKTGELMVESGDVLAEGMLSSLKEAGVETVEVVTEVADALVLNTLKEDNTPSHEEALLKLYARLRPGNPLKLEKAKELFHERFLDSNRYRLGRVGRFRLNRKFGQDVADKVMSLTEADCLSAIGYILKLRKGEGEVDDIDHLGNRRLRTIGELAGEEIRKGFLKLQRYVQDKMSQDEPENHTPRTLVNAKTVSSAIDYFFARGELSQVVDQTNPLSQLTHERRLSALGPGGLNRKRSGFEVRDVHASHYGRICPIETPEGQNIGLITYLAVHSAVDEHGFLMAPYKLVKDGRVTDEMVFLRADEETDKNLAPADLPIDERGRIQGAQVLVRCNGDFNYVDPKKVDYADVAAKQLVGVSAGLIPFLEHDDANRALMGSNMQRQAVPLLVTEPPLVATGMEKVVAENSSMVVRARAAGTVDRVTADEIVVAGETYRLKKFTGLNERTCLNQRPCVREGERLRKGQVIADGAATSRGELALGRNILAAFMPWDGYNFEDAIVLSQRLVKDDVYTSIHIEEFEVEIRETKLGREEFTRDIPNVSERALKNLDESGIIRIGTKIKPGDVLVGKVTPKAKSELSPEEKLLYAIFGKAGEDIKNESLTVPSGVYGVVVDAQKFSRKAYLSEEDRRALERQARRIERDYTTQMAELVKKLATDVEEAIGGRPVDSRSGNEVYVKRGSEPEEIVALLPLYDPEFLEFKTPAKREAYVAVYDALKPKIDELEDEKNRQVNHLKRGDELPTGVLEMVKVYIATKRHISVGDKMAGRHGNKGVVARIVPEEDMPFLEDGTPVDIVLNPLGVPSRMNVGQILETHLGWVAKVLGFQAIVPVFARMSEEELVAAMREAGLPEDGKVTLYDGRSGEPFEQKTTVGQIYMLKLHHLVDDKVHARATGPYSLITQQPLGGKARFGGQRYGEMEVWALEAYGAAHVLQEMMTVKSDDVEGRTKIYEAMVKGENILEAGTPVTFDVLTHELMGLGLNVKLEKKMV